VARSLLPHGKFSRRVVTFLTLIVLLIVFAVSSYLVPSVAATAIVGAANIDAHITHLPPLVIPPLPQNSRLLDAKGHVIATFDSENRSPVPLSAVAPIVTTVLISSEDRTFYRNDGVDPRGLARAFLKDLEGRSVQGGSTITEQYVKNLLELEQGPSAANATFQRKLNEIVYARQLDRQLTKQQIMEGYLNTVYFGANAYGVQAAAKRYFSIPASRLNLDQAALLVALVKSPSVYDPLVNPTLATTIRNEVLQSTYENHQITRQQELLAQAQPLNLHPSLPASGCAASTEPFFCDYVSGELLNVAALGATRDERLATLNNGGLTIRTTLVPSQQRAAQLAASSIVNDANRVGTAIVVVTPGTGAISAMAQNRVYGLDVAKNETTLNYADSPSPVGSTMKAFTLATAFSEGVPLNTILPAGARYHSTMMNNPPGGYFNNAEPSDGHDLTIAQATDGSVNTAFVQLEERVGVLNIARTASSMGLPVPFSGPDAVTAKEGSFTLGARGFTPIEMAAAYASLAAHGLFCQPTTVVSVTLASGQTKDVAPICTRALSPAVADTVTSLLAGVVTAGTGTGAAVPGFDIAGKTGTTTNFGSAWFDGYTPYTATAVWMGDPRGITYPLLNVAGVGAVYGGTLPAAMFRSAMTTILRGQPPSPIAPPSEIYLASSSLVVPDVADLPVATAMAILANDGLRVTGVTTGTAGTTSPPAGTSVTPGSTVTINSYGGPA